MCCDKIKGYLKVMQNFLLGKTLEPPSSVIKICNCGCEQNMWCPGGHLRKYPPAGISFQDDFVGHGRVVVLR